MPHDLPDALHAADPRHVARWVLLGCAVVGLATALCVVYVSVLSGVLVFLGGLIGLVLAVAWRTPSDGPRTPEAEYAALAEVWAREVPASRDAMVRAYLEDPEAAVAGIVGPDRRISPEVARQFLADRVTG